MTLSFPRLLLCMARSHVKEAHRLILHQTNQKLPSLPLQVTPQMILLSQVLKAKRLVLKTAL